MSDQSPSNSPSPSTETEEAQPASPSLRETIETAYDDVVDASEDEETGQTDRERDSLGRFVPKDRDEPGEQSRDPAPKKVSETQDRTIEPAPTGSSTRIPEHWSADFKADFAKLAPEGQAVFLKRYGEMEADYTRKSQASAGAVSFAQAIEPVFSDPSIQASLQQAGLNPIQAIHEWGAMQKRAMSPDPNERASFLYDLSQRLGFDPARLFVGSNRQEPQLSPEDMNDPAVQYLAGRLGEVTNKLNAFEAQQQQRLQAEAQSRFDETVKANRWQIDKFGEEKDSQGNPLHPYLDAVMPKLHEMFAVDNKRDLKEAYDEAVWANAETRKHMLEQERQQLFSQKSTDRARAAVRGNTRGLTSPVSRPNAAAGNGTLRSTLEASADEVGF